ncbi:MAG: MBL fold metallo-hydrolase, partial [Microbacteriaceae bacterium]|nr:MBL fold metallo-hydrolase [Microbacteriaceae bacterium]
VLQPALPVYSVFANLLAEPLVLPITMLGLTACLLSPLLPLLSQGISYLASIPAAVIIFVAQILSNAPAATITWFSGITGVVLSVLVTLSFAGLLVFRNKRVKAFSASALILVGLVFISQNSSVALARSAFYSGDYTLVNCDVGQGDGLVIRSSGQVAVIDVGRDDPAIDDCLSNLGIETIDLLVLTHFDMDHIGGVMGAITGRDVEEAILTSFHDDRPGADFAESALEAKGTPIVRAEKGMTGNLGDFKYQVLSPHRGAPEAEDSNDGSITMLWEDSKIALFTLADLGEKGQLRLGQEWAGILNSGFGGRQVIVKVAHHGSADQLPELYEAISPNLALISVGVHNSYGHPTSRTLGFLDLIGAQILRTDEMGALGISEVPAGLSVSVSGRS